MIYFASYESSNRSNDRDEIARVENPIYVLFVQARSLRAWLFPFSFHNPFNTVAGATILSQLNLRPLRQRGSFPPTQCRHFARRFVKRDCLHYDKPMYQDLLYCVR